MPIPTPIKRESGYPRIELTIDGKAYGFLLDTGAAYSMASVLALDAWSRAHPDWPTMVGAVGEANMLKGAWDLNDRLLRVPHALVGGIELRGMGLVSREGGTYEDYTSSDTTAPVVGAVAGNVLRDFRVGIDYAHGVTYLEQHAEPHDGDLDSPGLVLDMTFDGEVHVAGLARVGGASAAADVKPGDRLLSIDGREVAELRRGAIFQALHGRAGELRRLRLLRDGATIEVDAPVRHLL
jgi:hypothetical protein